MSGMDAHVRVQDMLADCTFSDRPDLGSVWFLHIVASMLRRAECIVLLIWDVSVGCRLNRTQWTDQAALHMCEITCASYGQFCCTSLAHQSVQTRSCATTDSSM